MGALPVRSVFSVICLNRVFIKFDDYGGFDFGAVCEKIGAVIGAVIPLANPSESGGG
jgi:hypothetical protein